MFKASMRTLRRRIIPIVALLLVFVAIIASFEASQNGPNQTFSFGVYWPAPTAYVSRTPLPNVYLGINYTGQGIRNYTYVISVGPAVLTTGHVPIDHRTPFKVLVHAPVPSSLRAEVYVQGSLVYKENLTLG